MTGPETQTEKHTRLALKLLDDAKREIAAGDLVQGSEKLWGATSQALKAYCASHGMAHSKYANRRHAAFQLADQTWTIPLSARHSAWPNHATLTFTTTGWSRSTWTATCRILRR